MFVVRYGDQVVHDPRGDVQVMGGSVRCALNEVSTLSFEIAEAHPLAGRIGMMDKSAEVTVERDGAEIFRGRVRSKKVGLLGGESYECEGQRGYLNDVLLPTYDTSEGTAPASVDGLFAWYIDRYNDKADEAHRFKVGINQGAALDPNNYVLRSNSKPTSVWEEVRSKLLEGLGGYVRMRYEDGVRYVDYLADAPTVSSQVVRLGINLIDFSRETDGAALYSSFVPVGKDDENNAVTIDSMPDGWITDRYYKRGGSIVDAELEARMGIVETLHECDAATVDGVYASGVRAIMRQGYADSITLTALDLSTAGIDTEPLVEGCYFRVTNEAAGSDDYLVCTARELDLVTVGADTYEVGFTRASSSLMAARSEGRTVSAEDAANAAAAEASSKRRVFTSEPVPPYDVGDLWVREMDGRTVVMVCNTSKGA